MSGPMGASPVVNIEVTDEVIPGLFDVTLLDGTTLSDMTTAQVDELVNERGLWGGPGWWLFGYAPRS